MSNGICQSHCRRSKEKKNAKDDERALRISKNVLGGFHFFEGFVSLMMLEVITAVRISERQEALFIVGFRREKVV